MISPRLFYTIGSLYIVNEHCAVYLREFCVDPSMEQMTGMTTQPRELFLVQHKHQIDPPRDMTKMARTHESNIFDSMCLEHMICI
jgi:hypothetical protein